MNTEPSTDPAPLGGPSSQPGGLPLPDEFAGLEDIRGPVFGYYAAAYTIEREEGFYAFAKLCRERPESVWETPDARAILSAGPCADPKTALEEVFKSVYKRLKVRRWNLPTMPATLPGDLDKPDEQ